MDRLQQEHLKEFNAAKERLEKCEKLKDDLEAVQERLRTLPEKLSHDIMVPFGGVAYMPGQLYHTNEILVLLGDNWFAKRSAKQASEIAERRKQYVVKQLESEKEHIQELQARLSFTEEVETAAKDHSDIVEIKEDYDPEEDKKWRERHRESLKAMAKERKRHAEDKTEAEMWARLEREESEMIKEEEEFGIMAHEITSLDAKAASPVIKKTTISFKHGQSHITETTLSQTQTGSNTPEPILYSSPADIYNQYAARAITKDTQAATAEYPSATESELRRTVTWDPEVKDTSRGSIKPHPPQPLQEHSQPLADRVVERKVSSSLTRGATENQPPTRKVSKFKSEKMKK